MTNHISTLLVWVCCALFSTATFASAQEPNPDIDLFAPPHLAVVDGAADLDRDGVLVPAETGQILAAGDRVTTRAGRVEILFGDGSALHLDQVTTIDLLDEGLLRLIEGRALLHVAPSDDPFEYRIDTPAASIRAAVPGEYRIVAGRVSELAVARGVASISAAGETLALRAGEVIRVTAGEPPRSPTAFNAAAWDAFDGWSQERRRPRVNAIVSAPLQGPLTAYNTTLTRHGTWSHHADHGRVWYPHVAAGWRPFYNGRWTTIAPFGWTWHGGDPWAWPTHYYGSWGVNAGGVWFWIPGVQWRPAAVHWTVTSTHIGWTPWGFGSLDVFGFTVVPRHVFLVNVNVIVPRHAFRSNRATLGSLVVAKSPPLPAGLVVPRAFGAERRPPTFVSATGSRADNRGTIVQRRTAQPRSETVAPARRVQADDRRQGAAGDRLGRVDSDRRDRPQLAPIDIPRVAVERVPSTPAERQQPALRAQPPLREQPALRSQGGSVPSGGAEWRMPRREPPNDSGSRPSSRAQPRAEPRESAPRRAPPRAEAPPQSSGEPSAGERRAVPRDSGSTPRRSRD